MPSTTKRTLGPDLSGILVIDKPLGPTSMDVVELVRRKAGGAKTGHAGTLDPLASGVLVIAIGPATKHIEQFMATEKRYETTIDLAAFTTTDDLQGDRTEVVTAEPPTEQTFREALHGFVGSIMQQPPSFSAKKVGGQRAYKMARKGQAVELQARPVHVHSIELMRYEWPIVELRIHCDKGFYVRSLARDLGRALNTGGHCVAIRRTAVGPFTADSARALQALPERISQSDLIALSQALALIHG
jgi:tRNA pseudouridine55 synthase